MATKILIVDDSLTVRVQTKKRIQEHFPDAEYTLAASGEEAVEKLNNAFYELCILDYNMEGMTGLEVAEIILNQKSGNHLFLCTANTQDSIQKRCKELGVHFMEKPLNLELILETFKLGA